MIGAVIAVGIFLSVMPLAAQNAAASSMKHSQNTNIVKHGDIMKIDKNLPAGNIKVVEYRDHLVIIEEEARDCREGWFYWKFRAIFNEPGKWTFRFTNSSKVGARGPAVSRDKGKSWEWLTVGQPAHAQEFVYECREPGEVWFCQGLPYLQEDWDRFAKEYSGHPAFHLSTLCRSRKGRNVELLEVREGNPQRTILLTARHHCQEMAASMVLEGILRFVLAPTPEGEKFRREFALFVVPFTDKDGVEEGDQGKGRKPRDHARDYLGKHIYPETAAIRQLIEKHRPFLVMDLHCPWIRFGDHNEIPYFVENQVERFHPEFDRISRLLEQEAPACAPFSHQNMLHWGSGWNSPDNYNGKKSPSGAGLNLTSACGEYPFVKLGASMEIPFANFGEKTMTRKEFLEFGSAIARTILRYAEEQK